MKGEDDDENDCCDVDGNGGNCIKRRGDGKDGEDEEEMEMEEEEEKEEEGAKEREKGEEKIEFCLRFKDRMKSFVVRSSLFVALVEVEVEVGARLRVEPRVSSHSKDYRLPTEKENEKV